MPTPTLFAHLESIRAVEAGEALDRFCEFFVASRGDQAGVRRVMSKLAADAGHGAAKRHGDINDLLASGLAGAQ